MASTPIADRTSYRGSVKFIYWLGPGGVWPYEVPMHARPGGQEQYFISSSGEMSRSGGGIACNAKYMATGESWPNQTGWPSKLVGTPSSGFATGAVVVGSPVDCPPPCISLDTAKFKKLFEANLPKIIANQMKQEQTGEAIDTTKIKSLRGKIKADLITSLCTYPEVYKVCNSGC